MKKTILTATLLIGVFSVNAQIFEEGFAGVTKSMSVTDCQKGGLLKNSDKFKFSGSGEVQNQGTTSNGKYTTLTGVASGGPNLRIAAEPGADIVISGINTKDIDNPVLGFGILKGAEKSNGSDLAVEYSLDGKRWNQLRFPPLPTGEGSALVWMYRVTYAPLPKAESVSVRFRQTGGGCVFRLDDISVAPSLENE